MNIFERIRKVQKEARMNDISTKYLLMAKSDYLELVDYLIEKKLIDAVAYGDTFKILGMDIILDERTIIRLPHGDN